MRRKDRSVEVKCPEEKERACPVLAQGGVGDQKSAWPRIRSKTVTEAFPVEKARKQDGQLHSSTWSPWHISKRRAASDWNHDPLRHFQHQVPVPRHNSSMKNVLIDWNTFGDGENFIATCVTSVYCTCPCYKHSISFCLSFHDNSLSWGNTLSVDTKRTLSTYRVTKYRQIPSKFSSNGYKSPSSGQTYTAAHLTMTSMKAQGHIDHPNLQLLPSICPYLFVYVHQREKNVCASVYWEATHSIQLSREALGSAMVTVMWEIREYLGGCTGREVGSTMADVRWRQGVGEGEGMTRPQLLFDSLPPSPIFNDGDLQLREKNAPWIWIDPLPQATGCQCD